ncbi:hypothetical protein RvY_05626 [Ramazzottius varieornatus]|uniref:DDE Tnp4 domain-containing protein n=1 Tax=Ramazzottius varieornatus TaxID=947166 RepID=A0A1D1UVP1_RAMVA|nr:hypothetical protein RvY_05626 [Ramazzottius varieornatus]
MELHILYALYYNKHISRKQFIILRRRMRSRKAAVLEEDARREQSFDLDDYSDKECRAYFRFKREALFQLLEAFGIPDVVRTPSRDSATGLEALCIVLRRLAYPNRWLEMRKMFGRSHSSLNRLFHATLRVIDRSSKVLKTWDHSWLKEDDFEIYADSIAAKGGPGVIRDVFAFIDGTARPICRPIFYQRQMFSGHERIHCTKWQSVVLPNGLILNLYGGQRGSMHDSRLLNESKILEELHEKQAGFVRKYVLYGDSGYAKKNGILHKPRSRIEIRHSKAKKDQNTLMSKLRQSVEWCSKEVVTKFAFVDFRKQMKLYEKPVNRIYRVAVLLTNCHHCLYPNQTSRYFDLEPPSLFEYLSCSQED